MARLLLPIGAVARCRAYHPPNGCTERLKTVCTRPEAPGVRYAQKSAGLRVVSKPRLSYWSSAAR